MASIPVVGRVLMAFVAIALFVQMVLFWRSSVDNTSSTDTPDAYNRRQPQTQNTYSPRNPNRNRRPTVPLSLHDLEELDELSDLIATREAYRVFENKEAGRIRGTTIRNNPEMVQRIRDQIHCWTTRGSWKRREGSFEPLKHLGDSRFSRCDKNFIRVLDREGSGHFLGEFDASTKQLMVREAVKYEWVPDEDTCGPQPNAEDDTYMDGPTPFKGLQTEAATYKHFTRLEFCEVLGKRDILVVGDLTQYQLHDVIASAFKSSFVCYGELGCLHHASHGLCNNAAVKYARNDFISVPWAVDPADDEYPSASAVEQTWASEELLQRYKVLLLNRGLIWRPDETFLQELVFTMKYLWKNYPDILVIYRATHPVSNCTSFKQQGEDEVILDKNGKPILAGTVLQKPLMTPPTRTMEGEGTDGRHVIRPTLADIQRQNRIAKRIVEAAGGIYLDTENMFALRPDGRMGEGDCSRFCAPGPLDAYADLLYNVFRILRHVETGGSSSSKKT